MKTGCRENRSFFARLCACSILLTPVAAFSFGELTYKSKLSGDEAFAAGDYPAAAGFYSVYAKDAAGAEDNDALRDAKERRLDALLLAGMTAEAEREFADYELKYPGVNSLSLSMWKADLRILQGRYAEALTIIRRILPGMTENDPRRLRSLAALARAEELGKNYAEAAKAYEELVRAAGKSPLALSAFARRIFCLANTKSPRDAMSGLLAAPLPENREQKEILRLLAFYVHLRMEGAADLNAAWRSIEKESGKVRLPIAYTLYSAIGDEAAKRQDRELAVSAYRLAFACAPTKQASFDTLGRIILLLDQQKEIEEAALLAIRALDLFKGPYASPETKLRLGRILRSAGKNLPAIELYLSLIQDEKAPYEHRKTAVRECAYLQNAMNDEAGARRTIRSFFNTEAMQPEAEFLLADLLLRDNRTEEAAEAFQELATKYPSIAGRALYQSALAWLSADKTDQAEQLADRLLQTVKKDPQAYSRALFLKAMILESARKFPEAQKYYTEYATRKPVDPKLAALALFKAAKMAFSRKNQLEAEGLFGRILNDYPKSELAPLAAYWRIYSFQARGDDLLAERETWLLVDRYPGSRYATDALFNLATHYADSGAASRANAVLDTLLNRVKSTKLYPKVLLEKANLAFREKDPETALALLEQLYQTNPDSSVLAEAFYLHGDVLKSNSEYEQAIAYYTKVLEHRPASLIELATIGSIADCQFTLAAQKNSAELYRSAMNRYDLLLKRIDLPEALRVMLHYKSGRCAEELDDVDTALKHYKAATYSLVSKVSSSVALWGTKAVEAIVTIAEKAPLKSHVEDAVRALQRLADAELMEQEMVDERVRKLEKMKFKP